MIKTYRYNELCNNVSLTISGAGGNSMRYNFTHGNTYMRKYPELTLRNKYAQDLLDNHELVRSGKVTCIRTTLEESDILQEEGHAKKPAKKAQKEEVAGIRTAEEVINYVNSRFDKDCRTLETAMKHADKAGLIFPDYGKE
jgi:hypothetical protein|nr:MAG TPA: hypothetical protein [Caudoviricetes sp.]